MNPLGVITVGAMVAAAVGYWGFAHRQGSHPASQDTRPPLLLGVILAGASASAFVGAAHILWLVAGALFPANQARASVPELPWDVVIISVAALIWVAFETIRQAICLTQRSLPPSKLARIYAQANLDLNEHRAEVAEAIARTGGVSTVELLVNARTAAARAVEKSP